MLRRNPRLISLVRNKDPIPLYLRQRVIQFLPTLRQRLYIEVSVVRQVRIAQVGIDHRLRSRRRIKYAATSISSDTA